MVIVANYLPDCQYSMLSHSLLVKFLLDKADIPSIIIRPRNCVGKLSRYFPKFEKLFGYIDKFLLFPLELLFVRFTSGRFGVFHIIDHSNSLYSFVLSGHPHVLTCNDLLAIKSARGCFPDNPVKFSGKLLQKIIVLGLNHCKNILCISNKTLVDLSFVLNKPTSSFDVTLLPLTYPFEPLSKSDCIRILSQQKLVAQLLPESGFILHVGGQIWYKNRLGLCQIYKRYVERLAGMSCQPLVLAGKSPSGDLQKFVQANRHLDIRFIANPSNEELNALYSLATVLFFPSIEEGFGWPILEAMSCGCPVITNSKPPMTEVGGDAAVYVDITSVDAAANTLHDVIQWSDHFRASQIAKCLLNAKRFDSDIYFEQLLSAYTRASNQSHLTE
ncbi:glycosyltransferase family 1 protein [Synechococcus sp. BMK-MC-1]|uniref:glycosyltransferase family 4 protein n=1 Tax=Synechococcus sp. BMK-MC-1 TaxID=1442551 RepID=UPI00164647E0|nr:glycosyltransferase family 1 protein [Synechococcus sp. BMK-MC-1]